MPRHLTRSTFFLPILLTLGCEGIVAEIGLPVAGGGLPITVLLQEGIDPLAVRVALDGADVTALFAPGPRGLDGTVPLPSAGGHDLDIDQPRPPLLPGLPDRHLLSRKHFEVPAATPPLERFDPAPVAGSLAQTAWLRLRFASDVSPEADAGFGFGIACDGVPIARLTYTVEGRSVLVDPVPGLQPGVCRVAWRGPNGVEDRSFSVASESASTPATPIYDRADPASLAPFPDDHWTVPDATSATGLRIAFEAPSYGDGRDQVLAAIEASLAPFDGWSPVGPIVLSFSHPVERSLLPEDEWEAQDPLAPLSLVDVDPASPDVGSRIPYRVEARDDTAPDGTIDHALLLFPSITLRPGGRYAVVVTRRLVTAGDPTRPFGASEFFGAVTGPPSPSDGATLLRVRERIGPLLEFLEAVPAVPLRREDVALALPVSIRSGMRDASDLVAMKENALVAAPPILTVESTTSTAARRLIVRGKLALPDYLGSPDAGALTRDPVTGRPLPWRSEAVPFVMSLPVQSQTGPVPVVIFQHGSPGGPEDVLGTNNEFLDDAGYAIVGIQDTANRRFGANSSQQTAAVLIHLVVNSRLPLLELQTHADLQSLLRAIQGLATRDWLPVGAPDGRLELDPAKLLYRGVSFGAHHSLGFLPLAPEVTAAVSLVGGGRFYENTLHQLDFFGAIASIQGILPTLRPVQLLVGLAAIQNDEDRQDPYFLARHLYRDRLPIAGIPASMPPPSLLWIEGIDDHVVSNNATRGAAAELGIPQVRRVRRESPLLGQLDAPLSGNLGPTRTAGHFQYEPALTPNCVATGQLEGHYCPQRANEARQQILRFFSTALAGGAPEIIDPLP